MWTLIGRKLGEEVRQIGVFKTQEGAISERERKLRPTHKIKITRKGPMQVIVPSPWIWTAIVKEKMYRG